MDFENFEFWIWILLNQISNISRKVIKFLFYQRESKEWFNNFQTSFFLFFLENWNRRRLNTILLPYISLSIFFVRDSVFINNDNDIWFKLMESVFADCSFLYSLLLCYKYWKCQLCCINNSTRWIKSDWMNYNVLLNCQTHSKFLALNVKCFRYQKILEKFDKLKRDTLRSNSIICKFVNFIILL